MISIPNGTTQSNRGNPDLRSGYCSECPKQPAPFDIAPVNGRAGPCIHERGLIRSMERLLAKPLRLRRAASRRISHEDHFGDYRDQARRRCLPLRHRGDNRSSGLKHTAEAGKLVLRLMLYQ